MVGDGGSTLDPALRKFQRDLDWNLLKVFNEIVRAGGISRAALSLARRQPAVSLALRRLEDRIGTILCQRGPAGFQLTDQGQMLSEICGAIDALVQQIPADVADLTDGLRGELRVNLISNLVYETIDEAISAFTSLCPNVELVIDIASWELVEASLLRNEADLGIAPSRFRHSDLDYALLFEELHRPYCGRAHPCFGRVYNDPSELADQRFVLTGSDEPDALRAYRLHHGLGRHIGGQSNHLEEARRLVKAGAGIGFLPEGVVEADVRRGEIWPVMPLIDEPKMDIFVITNPTGPRRRASNIFLELLKGCRRERAESISGPQATKAQGA